MKSVSTISIVLLSYISLFSGNFAGRWVGQYHFKWQDGRTSKDPVVIVLRQFDQVVEGSFGPNRFIQTRFKNVELKNDTVECKSSGIVMRLTVEDDSLKGEVKFGGAGAPQAFVKMKCEEQGNGGAVEPQKHSVIGRLETIEDFYMPQLDRYRRILVLLPPDYENSSERFPVIYMQDGQNLFDVMTSDRGEWKVDETLDKIVKQGKTKGFIIVGIEHGLQFRSFEYMPDALKIVPGAQGEKYAEFVVKTLKPYIDENYRTLSDRENSAVIGSSAGAQISFFIGTEYPDVFSKVGTLGFVMGANAQKNIEKWGNTHSKHPGMRIYLHASTEESLPGADNQMFVDNLKLLNSEMRKLGYGENEIILDIEPGGHHNEDTWSKSFPHVLDWLFK